MQMYQGLTSLSFYPACSKYQIVQAKVIKFKSSIFGILKHIIINIYSSHTSINTHMLKYVFVKWKGEIFKF